MRSQFTKSAVLKAGIFSGVFTLAGIAMILRSDALADVLLPSGILYALLMLNTFFSVRIFASITPSGDLAQNILDCALALFYVWIVLAIGDPVPFMLGWTLMFGLAIFKYSLLLGHVAHGKLLRHKILAQSIGTLAPALALAGILFGDPVTILWLWAAGFAVAQIDLFFLHPLYVFHRE